MADQTSAEIRAAIVRELADTHGNAAYLADNLAAVRVERDEYAADVERMTGTDARERLARHLYLDRARGDWQTRAATGWDSNDERINKDTWRRKAADMLAVVTGQENSR